MEAHRARAGGEDAALAVEKLQASQGKLGEAIYANQGDAAADDTPESTKDDEDIIDAEVVDDEDSTSDSTDKDSTK